MSILRSETLKLAAELPEGDPTRRKLLAALKSARNEDLDVETISMGTETTPSGREQARLLRVWVGYSKRGRPRGYYLTVAPVTVDEQGIQSHQLFSSERFLLFEAGRFSAKKLQEALVLAQRDPTVKREIENSKKQALRNVGW